MQLQQRAPYCDSSGIDPDPDDRVDTELVHLFGVGGTFTGHPILELVAGTFWSALWLRGVTA
jgi:hypothetical protein